MTSLGEDQQAFFSRIRSALGRQGATIEAPKEPPPKVDESLVRLAQPSDDLTQKFADNAEAVGMHVHRVNPEQVNDKLGELCDAIANEHGLSRVVVSEEALGRSFDVLPVFESRNVTRVDWKASDTLEPQFDTDLGVTDVRCAFAETGTMVVTTDATHSRGLSLVPPIHIALVKQSDILPDMLDFVAGFKGIPPEEMPSSIAYITGPSKTADIEGVLITGIHGPKVVHIILVDNL